MGSPIRVPSMAEESAACDDEGWTTKSRASASKKTSPFAGSRYPLSLFRSKNQGAKRVPAPYPCVDDPDCTLSCPENVSYDV